MLVKFTENRIRLLSGKDDPTLHPDDAFDHSFKNFILGLSLLLKRESERVKDTVKEMDVDIAYKDILYMDSVAKVLEAFEKLFTTLPIYKCLLNSKFTIEEISLIYTALHVYHNDAKKPFAKLFKDFIPELKKRLESEAKDAIKVNNDWYMVALGVVQGKTTIEPF